MTFGLTPDYEGRRTVWRFDRLHHILDNHPEMSAHAPLMEEVLLQPHEVRGSTFRPATRLYYRWYTGLTTIGDKYICVVANVTPIEATIITAYPTDKIIKGEILWQSEN